MLQRVVQCLGLGWGFWNEPSNGNWT